MRHLLSIKTANSTTTLSKFLLTLLIQRVYRDDKFDESIIRLAFLTELYNFEDKISFSDLEFRRIFAFLQRPSTEKITYFRELISTKLCLICPRHGA